MGARARTFNGRVPGLHYDVVQKPEGPSAAERKLDELTRQLEVDMRLSSPRASPHTSTQLVSNSRAVDPSVTLSDHGRHDSSSVQYNHGGR